MAIWSLRRAGRSLNASTDTDGRQAVGLLSCGTPTNGIDGSAMLAAVREEAACGWRITVGAVGCASRSGRPVDELPAGDSVVSCAVLDQDGNGSPAFVNVTPEPPYFEDVLGE